MPATSLMLLNPRRARKSSGRSGARRRRKMTAKQLRYFGPRRSRSKTSRRRSKPEVVIVSQNPKRRAAVSKKRRHRRAKHYSRNPRRAHRRHYRRNPIEGTATGFLSGTLVPAAIGAMGAIGVDIAIGSLPLPASMKTGTMLTLTRIGGALGIGFLLGMIAGEDAGAEAAAGGIIVTIYSVAKTYIQQNFTSITMARYVPLAAIRRRRRMARYIRLHGMGAVLRRRRVLRGMARVKRPNQQMPVRLKARGGMRGLGYINPARTSGPRGGPRFNRGMMRYIATKNQ